MKENPDAFLRMEFYADKLGAITNKNFQYNLAMAKIADAKGDRIAAEKYFKNAVKQAPSWAILWMEWGELLFAEKDYKGAIGKFEYLKSLAPDFKNWNSERERIWRISNSRFFQAMEMLKQSRAKMH